MIRSSPTGGNSFFAAVKYLAANIAISGNFVLTVKNSNVVVTNASHEAPFSCATWLHYFTC